MLNGFLHHLTKLFFLKQDKKIQIKTQIKKKLKVSIF